NGDAGIKIATGPHMGDACHRHMRPEPHARIQNHPRPHMAERPDLDAIAEHSPVFHHRSGMHRHPPELVEVPSWIMAANSASAQRSSPTKAWPENFHTGPRWRSFLTGMRSIWPGTTGFLNRADSMVMK